MQVGELDEVLEVGDGRVPAAGVEVVGERRAVVGGEHGGVAADLHGVGGVAGVLDVLRRRARLDDRAAQATRAAAPGCRRRRRRRRRSGRARSGSRGPRRRPPRGSCRRCARGSRALRSDTSSTGFKVRVRNGSRSTTAWTRAARRPSRPPPRRPVRVSLTALASAVAATLVAAEVDDAGEVRRRAVAYGNAIAATNSSWKRGSVAVSIFTTSRTASSISARRARDSSAYTAPAPAALPTERTRSTGQSGTSPSTIAWNGSMWAPNAPARRMSVISGDPACSTSSSMPARSAALASWIALTSFCVIVRRVPSPLVQHVGERAPVGHDTRACGRRARRGSSRRRR